MGKAQQNGRTEECAQGAFLKNKRKRDPLTLYIKILVIKKQNVEIKFKNAVSNRKRREVYKPFSFFFCLSLRRKYALI